MKKIPDLFLIVLGLSLWGCTTSEVVRQTAARISPPQSFSLQTELQSDGYVIRKGDQIQLSIWGYPEFATNTTVKETGTIAVPLVGEVMAAGLSKGQFTQQMRTKLSDYIQGEIKLTVTVVSALAQKINVLGAVARPQSYPVTGDISLLEILSNAGGPTDDADLQHIMIWHQEENNPPIEVNLSLSLGRGNVERLPILHPGDIVFVPKKENVIRNTAEFLRDVVLLFAFFRVLY
jgi:polysaccharide export outer membrane protein